MEEPELIFHDTVPLPDKEIPKARRMAKKQKAKILMYFRANSDKNFTPAEMYALIKTLSNKEILLTSVRRSITNLTKEGRLIKCQYSESREGRYGKLNRTWRYNTVYIAPITPQPHFRNPKNFYEKMNP